MDRVNISNNSFDKLRFNMQDFTFSDKEEKVIFRELNRLENLLQDKSRAIFSVSKYDDIYRGSLKIDSHNIFMFGKDPSVIKLFYRLRAGVEKSISESKQAYTKKTGLSLLAN